MNGTDWTAPGKGATRGKLLEAMHTFIEVLEVGENASPAIERAINVNRQRAAAAGNWQGCTNLRLTGEPLTAYDFARIAAAE